MQSLIKKRDEIRFLFSTGKTFDEILRYEGMTPRSIKSALFNIDKYKKDVLLFKEYAYLQVDRDLSTEDSNIIISQLAKKHKLPKETVIKHISRQINREFVWRRGI